MNLFHLHVEKEQGAMPRSRTWLVVADSLFEAMSVVPDGFAVRAVEVDVDTAVDPRPAIRSIAAPVKHWSRPVGRRQRRAPCYSYNR